MQTGEIRPGRHDLSTVQTRIATEHTSLVQPTLEAFQGRPTKRPVIERVIGFFERPKRNGTSAAEKRLKAIRQDQSSEPFRPFLELMLNSVDYGGDNLRVYVALTKDGGQQIVIGDRPDGLGMSTDVFLNTYLDPYASGSAANNRTPRGEYKRGLMGVGAQQQFGLLRHPQDRLIVSTSQAGETTVAEFIPGKRGRIEMTIGGKQDSGGDKSGVIQIIKLSSKTCREIGFTPEGLAAYLHERLALLEGKTIDMVVVGPQGREKSLDTANVSSAYAAGMQRGWESIQAAASPPISSTVILERAHSSDSTPSSMSDLLGVLDHTRGYAPRETVTYQITSPEITRLNLQEGEEEGVGISVSKEVKGKSLVYLNVLGVRFGEPFILEGQSLPSEIDVFFRHPMQVNEARSTVLFTRDDFKMLGAALQQLSQLDIVDDPTANVAFKLQVLDALSPFLKQMNTQNQWVIEKGCNLMNAFESTYRDVLQGGIQEGAKILPRSLEGILMESIPGAIFVNDESVRRYIPRSLETAGIKPAREVARNTYVASLQTQEPVWISPDGEMVILNEQYFSEGLNTSQVLRAKALLINLYAWGRVSPNVIVDMLLPAKQKPSSAEPTRVPYRPTFSVPHRELTPVQERHAAVPKPQQEMDLRALNEVTKLYVDDLRERWTTLTFEEKQQAFNTYIKMAYVDNPTRGSISTNDIVETDGYFTPTGFARTVLMRWYKLDDANLDTLWDVMQYGLSNGYMRYAPKLHYYEDSFRWIVNMKDFNVDVAERIKQVMANREILLYSQYFSQSTGILRLYNAHERKIPDMHFGLTRSLDSPEWDFIITHATELANSVGLQGEEREIFLNIFGDKNNLQAFSEQIASVFGTEYVGRSDYCLELARGLIALFPTEVGAIKRFLDTYEPQFALEIFKAGVHPTEYSYLISPKKALEIAIPTMQQMGIDMTNSKRVRHSLDVIRQPEDSLQDAWRNYSPEDILLWQIYHNELPIAYTQEQIQIPISGEINPATLLALSLRNKWKRANKASDILAFITSQPFDRDKMEVRLREQLHVINNLDHTPGSSVFELFKNSWQAIARQRISGDRATISFTDGVSRGSEGATYHLTLHDQVGMSPREALQKLLVPGEGEGLHSIHFLSVLKDFDVVRIRTSQGGKIGIITLQAIRNEKGAVTNFKTFYQEDNTQTPFVGTQIQLAKPVPVAAVDMEAGIFRQRIAEFGRNIPIQRAQVMLNGELLNEGHAVAFSTISPIGGIEIKPTGQSQPLIAVDDTPMPRYPLARILEDASMPELAKQLLVNSGFQLNIVGPTVKTTRDNGAFQDGRRVEKSIRQALSKIGKIYFLLL